MTITAKGYCSGAGGLDIGIMQAGINVIQSLDIDQKAIESLKRNPHYFSHSLVEKPIEEMLVKKQPATDIILCTYPCTKYSTIADIHGARTGDEIFLHCFRHIAIEQPEAYIIENVPGMKKFPVVMEAMTKLPNYYVNIFCPVETSNWLPQDRKRLIIFGTKKPFHVFNPTSERKIRIKDILEKEASDELPEYVISRLKGKYRDKPIIVDPDRTNAIAPTCVAHYAKDRGTRLVRDKKAKHGVRSFTVREYARLQGFPDDYVFPDELDSYRLIGNAVPVPMGRWIGEQLKRYFN